MRRALLPILALSASALVLAACGGGEQALQLTGDAAAGQTFAQQNCTGCHTTNGNSSTGPSFKGLAGSPVQLTDGRTVTADDAYLTRAILEPSAEVTKGYPDIMGRSYPKGSISDEQARQLVAYLNALK